MPNANNIFQQTQLRIDFYSREIARCDFCHRFATIQIRQPDLYDGDWKQACGFHSQDAIDAVYAAYNR